MDKQTRDGLTKGRRIDCPDWQMCLARLPVYQQRTNNPPLPEVTFTDDEAEWLWARSQDARRRLAAEREMSGVTRYHRGVPVTEKPLAPPWAINPIPAPAKPDRSVSALAACAIGAALFAVGYLLGRWLP